MSEEEENLDALFDAFDGDQEKEEQQEEQPTITTTPPDEDDEKEIRKETKTFEKTTTRKRKKFESENDKVGDDKEEEDVAVVSSTNQRKLVSSIPTSKKQDTPEKETSKDKISSSEETSKNVQTKEKEEEGSSNDPPREISTGTSHDKSIRTFTAHPDPKALNSLQEDDEEDHETTTTKPNNDYSSLPPAKTYPFPLDPFQSTSISYITQNQSVLVAAHTSAGKTVVAEYAIAQSLTHNQRVIYTSPIKALSNQKYRDLSEEFGAENVGLMTGDITINPNAICIVMTTEILRSMLYRGSEVMREVAWVIYDEVHYMRDKERGVVWEESIILLPHKVRFVFLSATIPNAKQFVSWIATIHHQICHVVYTNYRPTPLQHYIFAAGSDGLNLVVDEKGNFREKNFQRAMASLQGSGDGMDSAISDAIGQSGGSSGSGRKGRNNKRRRGSNGTAGSGKNGHTDLHRIVKLVMERNLNPVIIFSFSKKDCERYALELNKEDYTDDVEKDLISQVYKNAIESLSEDDRLLPQVEALLPLLKRGIGIHHGGLLPILKEIVEILFSEGLIKALFATETFVSL